eukprot:8382589-Pyramimonas_sp.AAC.1
MPRRSPLPNVWSRDSKRRAYCGPIRHAGVGNVLRLSQWDATPHYRFTTLSALRWNAGLYFWPNETRCGGNIPGGGQWGHTQSPRSRLHGSGPPLGGRTPMRSDSPPAPPGR